MIQLLILVVIALFLLNGNKTQDKKEHFHEKYGGYCKCCKGKSINQCHECFNCGFCIDKLGRGQCVPGDAHGPYNKNIKCAMWYHSDPFSRMLWYHNTRVRKPPCGGCRVARPKLYI